MTRSEAKWQSSLAVLNISGLLKCSADPRVCVGVSCFVRSNCGGVVWELQLNLTNIAAQPEERFRYTTLNHTMVAWPV